MSLDGVVSSEDPKSGFANPARGDLPPNDDGVVVPNPAGDLASPPNPCDALKLDPKTGPVEPDPKTGVVSDFCSDCFVAEVANTDDPSFLLAELPPREEVIPNVGAEVPDPKEGAPSVGVCPKAGAALPDPNAGLVS